VVGGEAAQLGGSLAGGAQGIGGARLPDRIDGHGRRQQAVYDLASLERGAERCRFGRGRPLDRQLEDIRAKLAPAV
jgi:hypothetical protein